MEAENKKQDKKMKTKRLKLQVDIDKSPDASADILVTCEGGLLLKFDKCGETYTCVDTDLIQPTEFESLIFFYLDYYDDIKSSLPAGEFDLLSIDYMLFANSLAKKVVTL